MDLDKIKTLIDWVSASSLSELEITEGEDKVRIVKDPTLIVSPPPFIAPQSLSEKEDTADAAITTAFEASIEGHRIVSPMVGSFYRASSPGAEPFIKIGDTVKEGQTLCIIEAMKLLNEIESDANGVVKDILVENGQAVEYGQPLFIIV